MLFALQDFVAALLAFAVWLQFVIGVVLFLLIFFYLLALVVGFLDLLMNPKSVFLSMIGNDKKKRRRRAAAGRSSRPKPQNRKPMSKKKRVPSGAPVEEATDAGGSFVLPHEMAHEMRAYFDEYIKQREV